MNWGSLDQELLAKRMDDNASLQSPKTSDAVMKDTLVESALGSAKRAIELGMGKDKIVVSAKVSKLPDLLAVYKDLYVMSDFPLHVGLTEAGLGIKGIVSSAAAISILLNSGIGDTIRVSLTPNQAEIGERKSTLLNRFYNRSELELFLQRLLLALVVEELLRLFSRIGAEYSISCSRLYEGVVGQVSRV